MNKKNIYEVSEMWRNHTGRNDIATGLMAYHVWGILGMHDIKQRYRRSVLGPFWFTLSTFIMVGVLGFLYSTILNQDIHTYLPFLAIGLVLWQFLSTCINEGASTFLSASGLIKQVRIPLTVHVVRVVWRNFSILLHSLPVMVLFIILMGIPIGWGVLLVLPALLILYLHGIWTAITLAIICARYRDVIPMVTNLVQIAFFFTPIMWTVKVLDNKQWVAQFNPIYHVIETVRAPILGMPINISSWYWSFGTLVIGFAIAQILMVLYRERVSYWI